MQSIVPSLLAVSTALLPFLVAFPAWAGSAANLSYEAPEGCPPQQEFVAAVEARGGQFGDTGSVNKGRIMAVVIRNAEGRFVGTFQVRSSEGTSNPREVHGAACSEVVDALAIATAIALRPEQGEPPAAPPPETLAAKPEPPEPVVRRFRGRSSWGRDAVAVNTGTLHIDPLFSWTLSAGAVLGPFPSVVMSRYELSFHLANFVTTPDGGQRVLGPILRGRASLAAPPDAKYRTSDTTTTIQSNSLGFGVCWSPYYDTRGLVLLGCVELGLGIMALSTQENDVATIQSKSTGYATSAGVLEAEYNLGRLFHIGAKLGSESLLGEITVERADGSRIFKSAAIQMSPYALLGVGLHF